MAGITISKSPGFASSRSRVLGKGHSGCVCSVRMRVFTSTPIVVRMSLRPMRTCVARATTGIVSSQRSESSPSGVEPQSLFQPFLAACSKKSLLATLWLSCARSASAVIRTPGSISPLALRFPMRFIGMSALCISIFTSERFGETRQLVSRVGLAVRDALATTSPLALKSIFLAS